MKIAKEFVLRTIADENILIPVGETSKEFSGMINLTSVGAFIWKAIESTDSLQDLVDRIIEEFEVERSVAEVDTKEFITELVSRGLVVPTKEDKSW